MSKKQYSTRLPPDKAKELDEYCQETGIAKSEVIRRSIDDHLTEQGEDNDTDNNRDWGILTGVGILAVLVSQSSLFQSYPVPITVVSTLIYASILIYFYFN